MYFLPFRSVEALPALSPILTEDWSVPVNSELADPILWTVDILPLSFDLFNGMYVASMTPHPFAIASYHHARLERRTAAMRYFHEAIRHYLHNIRDLLNGCFRTPEHGQFLPQRVVAMILSYMP
jgi:hypothetical protein